MATILKCKLCKKDFEERENLKGLRVCQACDDSGKSGIGSRCHIQVIMREGKQKHVPIPLFTAAGVEILSKEVE